MNRPFVCCYVSFSRDTCVRFTKGSFRERDVLRGRRDREEALRTSNARPYGIWDVLRTRSDREPWKEAAPVCEIATSPTGVSAPRNDSKRKGRLGNALILINQSFF